MEEKVKPHSKNRNIKNEFSKIIERSNEESEFMEKFEDRKPKIREIEVEHEELINDSNNQSQENSEVVSRSGNGMVPRK